MYNVPPRSVLMNSITVCSGDYSRKTGRGRPCGFIASHCMGVAQKCRWKKEKSDTLGQNPTKKDAMPRTLSRACREVAFVENAKKMYASLEDWRDANPDAGFGKIETEARKRRRCLD